MSSRIGLDGDGAGHPEKYEGFLPRFPLSFLRDSPARNRYRKGAAWWTEGKREHRPGKRLVWILPGRRAALRADRTPVRISP
jgi:hypothetical protein